LSRASFQIEIPTAGYDELADRATGFLTELGYEEIDPEKEGARLFRKGKGVLTAPMFVEMSSEDRGATRLVNFDGFVTVYLFLTQGKVAEQSFTPEFTLGVIPRRMGYKDFVKLRAHLRGEEIEEEMATTAGRSANKLMVGLAVIIPAFIVLIICLCILLCFGSSIINVITSQVGM
jgi:hypothetical protein